MQPFNALRVEVAGGFVQQHHGALRAQCKGKVQALFLAGTPSMHGRFLVHAQPGSLNQISPRQASFTRGSEHRVKGHGLRPGQM